MVQGHVLQSCILGQAMGRGSRGAVDLGGDAGAVVALGDREVVAGLQVYPEPGAGAEMAGKPKRRVRADRTPSAQESR